jgi:hypothetical protein
MQTPNAAYLARDQLRRQQMERGVRLDPLPAQPVSQLMHYLSRSCRRIARTSLRRSEWGRGSRPGECESKFGQTFWAAGPDRPTGQSSRPRAVAAADGHFVADLPNHADVLDQQKVVLMAQAEAPDLTHVTEINQLGPGRGVRRNGGGGGARLIRLPVIRRPGTRTVGRAVVSRIMGGS